MTSRPSRSLSIPIPRSSAARSIESVITLPLVSPSRTRVPQPGSSASDDHRISHSIRSVATSSSVGSVRPTARSFNHNGSSMHIRGSPQTRPTMEPRVIRPDPASFAIACNPSSPSPRTRRSSTSAGVRSSIMQRSTSGPISHPQMNSLPAAIARPSYLEHSALRHMLQPESPSTHAVRMEDSHHETPSAYSILPTSESDEHKSGSPSWDAHQPNSVQSSDGLLKLPTQWCAESRNSLLTVSADGRELFYNGGSTNGDKDAAAARTIHPIPPACGIFYYEVDIRSKGSKAHISVGFSARDVKFSRLPGWEAHSWGYHGDDGCSFAAEKNGSAFGPQFGLGDTIGCGIDFTSNRAFYTKNATLIGHVFENVGKGIDLYPAVGLQHGGESILVNFGHEPFKYDIEFHVQQSRNQTWSNILCTQINPKIFTSYRDQEEDNKDSILDVARSAPPDEGEKTKAAIDSLVLSYLAHHGYAKTARALQTQLQNADHPVSTSTKDQDVDMDSITPRTPSAFEADIEIRTRIAHNVVAGDIDAALEETQLHHPKVLEAEGGLMLFKLRCRKFVELILKGAEIKRQMGRTEHISRDGQESTDEMDVDDDSPPVASPTLTSTVNGFESNVLPGDVGQKIPGGKTAATARYDAATTEAIAYGQMLQADYKGDPRPEVEAIFQRTFGIVAWDDPLRAGGSAAEVAGHHSRVALANELNQAILRSQGKPSHPALETLYRHTAVCVLQLGVLGNGAAAFADMSKEFLET